MILGYWSLRFYKNKLSLIVFGTILALVIVELGLRLSGSLWMFRQKQANQNFEKSKKILCLGESTTGLGGDYAYPRLLQQELNHTYGVGVYEVINKGIPGITTSQIIQNLEMYLNKYRPHMVIAMLGINDDPDGEDSESVNIFQSLRVVKLWNHLRQSLMGERYQTNGWLMMADGNFEEAKKIFEDALQRNPNSIEAHIDLSLGYAFSGNYLESEQIIQQAMQKDPNNIDLYIELGQVFILQKKWKQAEQIFEQAQSIEQHNNDVQLALGWCYLQNGKIEQAENIFKMFVANQPNLESFAAMELFYQTQNRDVLAREYYDKKRYVSDRMYGDHTKLNLHRLRDQILRRGIRLVAMQYPRRSVAPLQRVLGTHEDIIYIDNEEVFNQAILQGSYQDYFVNNFAGDFGHCTRAGNALLVRNLMKTLMGNLGNRL